MSAQVKQKKKPLLSHKKNSEAKGVQLEKPVGVGNIMKKLDAEITKSKEGKLPLAFKKKWLEALRSGKYTQVKGSLAKMNGKKWQYCVLGVAAKVAGYKSSAFESNGTLRSDLEKIPEIIRNNSVGQTPKIASDLIGMNDGQSKSFKEIADYIEKEL